MIKEIEALMVHWGEQRRRHGLEAGIGSQMGTIMQWKGAAPRGTPGSRVVSGGLGMGHRARELEAVVSQLARSGEKGRALAKLAQLKYIVDPEPTVREQMRELGIAEGADRTYRNYVARLHNQILALLIERCAQRDLGGYHFSE